MKLTRSGLKPHSTAPCAYEESQVSDPPLENICVPTDTAIGCGKTVLARFMYNTSAASLTLAHFFQASSNLQSTTTASFVASILTQALRWATYSATSGSLDVIEHLLNLSRQHESVLSCPIDILWSAMMKLLGQIPNTTLIIDALDEARQEYGEIPMVERLHDLIAAGNARIIILVRSSLDISSELGQCRQLDMNEDCVAKDIVLFVQREIQRCNRLRRLENEILVLVSARAQGMFLWAVLMLDYIKSAPTRNMVLESLPGCPRGLAEFYKSFLLDSSIKSQPQKLQMRSEILQLLIVASRPLSVLEITYVLGLKTSYETPDDGDLLLDPDSDIVSLCRPFVVVRGHHVELIHQSVKEYLTMEGSFDEKDSATRFPLAQCHRHMAMKCFFELLQTSNGSTNVIRRLLEKNSELTNSKGPGDRHSSTVESPFYEYASHYWCTHLLAARIDQRILFHARIFLSSSHIITWAESVVSFQRCQNVGPVIDIISRVEAWSGSLMKSRRAFLNFSNLLEPFIIMMHLEDHRGTDQYLVLLLLHRLGAYANLGLGDPYEIRRQCVEKAFLVLGPRHRLTLGAITDFAIERSVDDEAEAAEQDLASVSKAQFEVLGNDFMDTYYSRQCQAVAMFRQMKYQEALVVQNEASAGLRRILGPIDIKYLKGRLFLSKTLSALGRNEEALKLLEETWNSWSTLQGAHDPFSMAVQGFMGAVHRKLHNFELAEHHFSHALANRQRIYGNKIILTADLAINLVALKRDAGDVEGAFAMLDVAYELFDREEHFMRACQLEHLRALLYADCDQAVAALHTLKRLSREAQFRHEPGNRELYWTKLTWADVLRRQSLDNEVASLFDDLTVSQDGCLRQQESTTAEWHTVEKALRQVCGGDLATSVVLLSSISRRWKRVQDFYVPLGGPMAHIL